MSSGPLTVSAFIQNVSHMYCGQKLSERIYWTGEMCIRDRPYTTQDYRQRTLCKVVKLKEVIPAHPANIKEDYVCLLYTSLALDRDQYAVGRDQRVERNESERRGAVDQNEVVTLAQRSEQVSHPLLSVLDFEQFGFGSDQIDARR